LKNLFGVFFAVLLLAIKAFTRFLVFKILLRLNAGGGVLLDLLALALNLLKKDFDNFLAFNNKFKLNFGGGVLFLYLAVSVYFLRTGLGKTFFSFLGIIAGITFFSFLGTGAGITFFTGFANYFSNVVILKFGFNLLNTYFSDDSL